MSDKGTKNIKKTRLTTKCPFTQVLDNKDTTFALFSSFFLKNPSYIKLLGNVYV